MPAEFQLQQLLTEKGMSQSELARRTGISFTTINAIANNKTKQVQLETLDLLAEVLEVEIGDLIRRVPKPRRKGAA